MVPEPLIKQILGAINHEELIGLTQRLVRTVSVWDPVAGTGEKAAATLVAEWATDLGFNVIQEEASLNRPNVIIKWSSGIGARTLLFEGHTDVVTPGDSSAWRHDPFGADIVGNRMYGRGTCDTKGNLAAMLIAMAALKRINVDLNGTVIGAVLCDEEDQMLGVRDFIRRGHADAVTGAIICEPQDGLICTSQKGAIRARYGISGKMTHGAMPLTGLNTAPAVSRIIERLHQLELSEARTHGRDAFLGWPSFTPTVIQAPPSGTPQLNVLPGKSDMRVDIRTIPKQSHSEIIERLSEIRSEVELDTRKHYEALDRFLEIPPRQDMKIQMEILTDRPCTYTSKEDPVVRATHWATQYITNQEPEYAGVPGSTDGTYLWSEKNIPIVTIGAGDRQVPHQVDEWVDIDQLHQTAQIYALAALHYFSSS